VDISLGLAFLGGLLSFLSPCVLPLVPAYIGYLGGRMTQAASATTGEAAVTPLRPADRLNTALHGVAFVAGFTTLFVLLGLATTIFVQVIGGQNIRLVTDILGRIGGTFLIILSLQLMDAATMLSQRGWKATQFSVLLAGILALALLGELASPGALNLTAALPDWMQSWSEASILFWILAAWLFTSGVMREVSFMRSPLSILVFGVVVARLIVWMLIDGLFALPILALFLLWLFLWNALDNPHGFWQRVHSSLQSLFYADTRAAFDTSRERGLGGSYFMGLVFSAGWTPCIGPIYGGILTLAATTGNVSLAGSQLLSYSLGLGVPFLLAALLMDGAQGFLRRLQRHMRTIKLLSGALLLIIGIAVASGRLQELSRTFAQQFADFSYQLETCSLRVIEGSLPAGQFGNCMQGGAELPPPNQS
jgi:cytochrome c biogenesis protein CcdA